MLQDDINKILANLNNTTRTIAVTAPALANAVNGVIHTSSLHHKMLENVMQDTMCIAQEITRKYQTCYADIFRQLDFALTTQSKISRALRDSVLSIYDVHRSSGLQNLINIQTKVLKDFESFSSYCPNIKFIDGDIWVDDSEITQSDFDSILEAITKLYDSCEQKWDKLPRPIRWLAQFIVMLVLSPYINAIIHNPETPDFSREQMIEIVQGAILSIPANSNMLNSDTFTDTPLAITQDVNSTDAILDSPDVNKVAEDANTENLENISCSFYFVP